MEQAEIDRIIIGLGGLRLGADLVAAAQTGSMREARQVMAERKAKGCGCLVEVAFKEPEVINKALGAACSALNTSPAEALELGHAILHDAPALLLGEGEAPTNASKAAKWVTSKERDRDYYALVDMGEAIAQLKAYVETKRLGALRLDDALGAVLEATKVPIGQFRVYAETFVVYGVDTPRMELPPVDVKALCAVIQAASDVSSSISAFPFEAHFVGLPGALIHDLAALASQTLSPAQHQAAALEIAQHVLAYDLRSPYKLPNLVAMRATRKQAKGCGCTEREILRLEMANAIPLVIDYGHRPQEVRLGRTWLVGHDARRLTLTPCQDLPTFLFHCWFWPRLVEACESQLLDLPYPRVRAEEAQLGPDVFDLLELAHSDGGPYDQIRRQQFAAFLDQIVAEGTPAQRRMIELLDEHDGETALTADALGRDDSAVRHMNLRIRKGRIDAFREI